MDKSSEQQGKEWIQLDSMNNQLPVPNNEKLQLVNSPKRRIPQELTASYKRLTLIVTWLSIVCTTSLGIVAIVFSIEDESSSTFAFGLDALLDTLSSLVVAWRYMGYSSDIYSSHRERTACILISVLFIISSLIVSGRSAFSMLYVVLPTHESFLWKLAIANGSVSLFFTVFKAYLGYVMESRALVTDSFNSFIGAVMGFGSAISSFIYEQNQSVWYLDAALGIACSLLLLTYGLWLLIDTCNQVPQSNSMSN